MTRGVELCNPGNLERDPKVAWLGQLGTQTDPRFVGFINPLFGFRALALVLLHYVERDGCAATVREIVTRYEGGKANPDHNNIPAYILFVSQQIGFDPDATLELRLEHPTVGNDLPALMWAMSLQEIGDSGWRDQIVGALYAAAGQL